MTCSIDTPGPADEITRDLGELVRLLNHALLKDGVGYPSDIYTVVGGLGTAAAGLPHVLNALELTVADLGEQGHVRVDDDSDPTGRIAHTITSLRAAAAHAREMTSSVVSGPSARLPRRWASHSTVRGSTASPRWTRAATLRYSAAWAGSAKSVGKSRRAISPRGAGSAISAATSACSSARSRGHGRSGGTVRS
ncbi:hypothetical protein OG928_15675 [Embleya sp. NBC_00896]|nr:hypothetical protein OG928_15675 [Embleya sp. NBC_00896]